MFLILEKRTKTSGQRDLNFQQRKTMYGGTMDITIKDDSVFLYFFFLAIYFGLQSFVCSLPIVPSLQHEIIGNYSCNFQPTTTCFYSRFIALPTNVQHISTKLQNFFDLQKPFINYCFYIFQSHTNCNHQKLFLQISPYNYLFLFPPNLSPYNLFSLPLPLSLEQLSKHRLHPKRLCSKASQR